MNAAGYQYISEAEDWTGKLQRGGKYYTTRNQTSIVAFAIGKAYDASSCGFNISAAHTDSPCLRIKPVSKVETAGALQVGVECYGGGLWHTWFDRDLGVSGRILISDGEKATSKIITINKPILRIPNLAIHLNRAVNEEGFKFNKEDQLVPILSTYISQLMYNAATPSPTLPAANEHNSSLLHVIAEAAGCNAQNIECFDLSLCDVQPAVLGGIHEEFIYGGRLDNLMMSFVCLHALKAATTDALLEKETQIQMAVCFDNEEIGSATAHGADSTIMQEIMERIGQCFTASGKNFSMPLAIRKSFLFSCDMAHALHPNYKSKHESNHAPMFHAGPVIKENANARYATTVETKYITKKLANKANVPVQAFVVRNDSACGSTIGPILASRLGLRCVDIGIAQLSMHSIREMAGTVDLVHSTKLLQTFYTHFAELDKTITTD